jgi:hypothetical protein
VSELSYASLPLGPSQLLSASRPPNLQARGYVEREYAVTGVASSYTGEQTPFDGRVSAVVSGTAPFTTRLVVRRPAAPESFSGTVVAEWLNVSSGDDAAPEYTYLGEEVVRRGHAWIGVSAQFVGVEGGSSTVGSVPGAVRSGLKNRDRERYGDLCHPGDAFSYDIFTLTVRGLVTSGGPLDDLPVTTWIAVGESQAAFALTTYINAVQPLADAFDGFLVHSRGGAAMGWGRSGEGFDLDVVRRGEPVQIRTDGRARIMTVQTETDVVSPRLRYFPARQDDAPTFRLWEMAGTAHADHWQIGEFEELLGCPDPVNRGQQVYVLRGALRALELWCTNGTPPAAAGRLMTHEGDPVRLVDDPIGNATGGVRTPVVDAAVEVHSGSAAPGSSPLCSLFGRTLPGPPEVLLERYADEHDYLDDYRAATEAAIRAGFVLAEDRDAVLAEARPDLVRPRP